MKRVKREHLKKIICKHKIKTMKVIALRGGVDTGKSHTINIVYSFLLRDGFKQDSTPYYRDLGDPIYKDFIDVLARGELRIGIVGMGDYVIGRESLANLIKELSAEQCSVVICACRDTPKIVDAVAQYPNHFFVDKTPSTGKHNHRIVNVQDAERMIQLI